MVQQTVDSKFSEYGLGNAETNLPTRDKQFPVAVKKMALRDVQNENRIPNSTGRSPLLKERGQTMDAIKVSGTKRTSPECPTSSDSPIRNAVNAHIVYVRRKSDPEIGRSNACNGRGITSDCLFSRHPDHSDENTQSKPELQDPKVSSFPAFAPIPVASFINTSGKPSVPVAHGPSNTRFASAESNYHCVTSVIPSSNNSKGMKNLHWEERYRQLQILLKKLDESDQEDYLQMLRSVSSVELSRHAVELEKRTIQLSLEEAKEVQRVANFNVLGKSIKNNIKASSTHQGQSEK